MNMFKENIKRQMIKDYKKKNINTINKSNSSFLINFYEKFKYIYLNKNGRSLKNYLIMYPFILKKLGELKYFEKFAHMKISIESVVDETYSLEQLYNLRVFYNPKFRNKKLKKKNIKIKLIYRLSRQKHPYTICAYETYDSEDVEFLVKPKILLTIEESSDLIKARHKALIAFSKNILKNAIELSLTGNVLFYKKEDIDDTLILKLKQFHEELLHINEVSNPKELIFNKTFLKCTGKFGSYLIKKSGQQSLYQNYIEEYENNFEKKQAFQLMMQKERYLLFTFVLFLSSLFGLVLKLFFMILSKFIIKIIVFINKGPLYQRFLKTLKFSEYRGYNCLIKLKTIGIKIINIIRKYIK